VPDYRVLGGCLRSALEFPELPSGGSHDPSWQLDLSDQTAPETDLEILGSDSVRGAFGVQLFRTPQGFRLSYSDTGIFDITTNGSRICWYRPPVDDRPWNPEQFLEAARIDVLGRVLAVAMHAQGIFCLHGSAVRIGGKAIAFLAPKYHGKSTLAYALVTAGAGLITDDTLPIELGRPNRTRAGVHSVRMWEDSAERFKDEPGEFSMGTFGKLASRGIPGDRLVHDTTPLAAIYLLVPVRDEPGIPRLQLRSLDSIAAALGLVQHAKIGALLGKAEAVRMFEWAADLSRSVPVELLVIIRDYEQLPLVVQDILERHGGTGAGLT
jgi:hypothetical protein